MRLKALLILPIVSIIGISLTIRLFGSLFVDIILKTIFYKRDESLNNKSIEMWKCRKCCKPVYFAERKCSLGYDWHPHCLTCEECGKRLNPGQHAEHKGIPYCYIPCYGALFGPTLYGHGSRVESHSSFGNKPKLNCDQMLDKMLETKLKEYNQYYEGKSNAIHYRERNGKFILEGSIRIYWDVSNVIQLKEDNDDRVFVRKRSSFYYRKRSSLKNTSCDNLNLTSNSKLDLSKQSSLSSDDSSPEDFVRDYRTLPIRGSKGRAKSGEKLKTSSKSFDDEYVQQIADAKCHNKQDSNEVNSTGEVVLRRTSNLRRSRVKLKRRCSINGHYYNRETSTFTPAHGSVTSVWISSLVNAPEVINLLLDKFKVTNKPEDFALFILRDNGECKRIQDNEFPLVVRVMLGPNETAAKVFIFNKNKNEISSEVAQYLRLRNTELQMFLKKFEEEEIREVNKIKKKYADIKMWIKIRMKELQY